MTYKDVHNIFSGIKNKFKSQLQEKDNKRISPSRQSLLALFLKNYNVLSYTNCFPRVGDFLIPSRREKTGKRFKGNTFP